MQGIDKVLAIGQVQPSIMRRFDWDEVGKFLAKSGDFPQQLTLDDAAVDELNAADEQQAQEAAAMEQVERAAGVAGALPPQVVDQAIEGGEAT